MVSAEEAQARFARHVALTPLPGEMVALAASLNRVLAHDVMAAIDVPPFDRSNVDGFALRAADSAGASDTAPVRLCLNAEVIVCGHSPTLEVAPRHATTIATGGVLPRGADAVAMVEHTDLVDDDAPAIETSDLGRSFGDVVALRHVTFSVPEARLADIKRYSDNGKLGVTARAQDGSGDIEQGELTFIDNSVDTSTGTIKLKGTFQNKAHKLWPGQFVNVGLRLTMRNNAVVVPNQAVQTGQDGTYVYVVGEDRTVSVVPIKTGPRIDQDMVIDEGLKGGETVVTEGQLRLQPGSKVQIREPQT